ncbi:MAG: formyltransferase family protein [bacterium]
MPTDLPARAAPARNQRLVLAGKGRIACTVAGHVRKALASSPTDWTVLGLPVRGDNGQDSWEPSFTARCRTLGIPVLDTVTAAGLRNGDLLLSLQYDRIIRLPELGGARAYNLHFSALPRHRGCYPGIWALRSGDTHAGVSLHVLTAGIDDGAVVDQTLIPLRDNTTARELYEEMHHCGALLVQRHLADLMRDRVRSHPQDDAQATYHDRRSVDFNDRELPFAELDAASCSRLARSLIFPPFQHPTVRGRAIVACEVASDVASTPSTKAGLDIHIEAADIWLLRCREGWLRASLAPLASETSP